MVFFRIATLLPLALLCAGAVFGGHWVWAALAVITVLTWALDHLIARQAVQPGAGSEFPAGTGLCVFLGLMMPVLLGLAVWSVGGASGHGLAHRLGLAVGFGLYFGQVGHPVAHELIHKPSRPMQRLGRMIYTGLLMGHHASSHLRVHHIHVATPHDPASAPAGMGFWHYVPRAWIGSFRAGLAAETALRRRAGAGGGKEKGHLRAALTHPYAAYLGGAALTVLLAHAVAGLTGIAALLAIAAYAQIQILLSDYVQHYGLRRALRPDGRYAPVGPAHSWNAPQFWSSAMMLNAPRHSHHHIAPGVAYPALQLSDQMPILPRAVPVMAVAALVPPLWHRMMRPALKKLTPAHPTRKTAE